MSPTWGAVIEAFFSLTASIFYVIAASGYSTDQSVVKNCAWIWYDYGKPSVDDWYFGLKGIVRFSNQQYSAFYYYNYPLYECERAGLIAFCLSLISCTLSFICVVANIFSMKINNTSTTVVATALSFISSIAATTAVSIFMTSCFNKIYDNIGTDKLMSDDFQLQYRSDLVLGNGSILVIAGLSCNFLVVIISIGTIIFNGIISY